MTASVGPTQTFFDSETLQATDELQKERRSCFADVNKFNGDSDMCLSCPDEFDCLSAIDSSLPPTVDDNDELLH